MQVLAKRKEGNKIYVLGKDSRQYAIGVMTGKKKDRLKWKAFFTGLNLPEGVFLEDVIYEVFRAHDPLTADTNRIIALLVSKNILEGFKKAHNEAATGSE